MRNPKRAKPGLVAQEAKSVAGLASQALGSCFVHDEKRCDVATEGFSLARL